MIKALIIEDEIQIREGLKKMLSFVNPDITILGETGLVAEALELVKTEKPDLIFLDIELEDGSGFDLLKQLENIDFKIIFATAYSKFAIQAFKFSAVDYLLKPIDPSDLKEALNKAIQTITNQREHQELLTVLKNNLNQIEQSIVLKTADNRYVLKLNDIIRLEADGAYTKFISKDQKLIISKNLKHYQGILNDEFIRCHQSHLVNSKHITGMQQNCLILSNQEKIPISNRKKTEIVKFINQI